MALTLTDLYPPTRELPPFGLPSTCRRCPASGLGPTYDTTEDPHTITWRRGSTTVTCEYECRVCGCEWSDTWPVWGLLGPEPSP
jgi:hypothetical protein